MVIYGALAAHVNSHTEHLGGSVISKKIEMFGLTP